MLKNSLLGLMLVLLLPNCSNNENKYKDIILLKITENAMGVDIKPEFDSIVFVAKYNVEDITNFWIKKELREGGNIDSLINMFANVDKYRSRERYNWLKWQQTRFNQLKTMNKNDLLFEVVKAYYKIEVPILKTKTSVLNYYIISSNKVLSTISENDMRDAINDQIQPEFIYEYSQFMNKKTDLP